MVIISHRNNTAKMKRDIVVYLCKYLTICVFITMVILFFLGTIVGYSVLQFIE